MNPIDNLGKNRGICANWMNLKIQPWEFDMLKLTGLFLSVFALLAILSITAIAVDLQADYFNSVAKYFDIKSKEVNRISESGIIDEELPIVFFVAGRANVAPQEVAETRLSGESWMKVCDKYLLGARDLYMIVTSPVKSITYGPIFEKFSKTPQKKWKTLEFTDDEIVNLVNLKLMSSLHDYSVYDIMAMRDYGKSFLRINQQVTHAKKDIVDKQNKVLEAR